MQATKGRTEAEWLARRAADELLVAQATRPAAPRPAAVSFWVPDRLTFQNREDVVTLPDSPTQFRSSGWRWFLVRRSHSAALLGPNLESVRKALWFMETGFSGEASHNESFVATGISRYYFALDAAIRAWWKRIFELIRETLLVERRRHFDDVEPRINANNPIEVYSPIFRWLSGRD
jgi:hypothetical protein